jgi:hypothetical protein
MRREAERRQQQMEAINKAAQSGFLYFLVISNFNIKKKIKNVKQIYLHPKPKQL